MYSMTSCHCIISWCSICIHLLQMYTLHISLRLLVDEVMKMPLKSKELLFPKGGWKKDGTIEDAVQREALEEAEVQGEVECKLGTWYFENKLGEAVSKEHYVSSFCNNN